MMARTFSESASNSRNETIKSVVSSIMIINRKELKESDKP